MAKYLSKRQPNFNVGISSYTESDTVLQTIGKVGIGTTNAQQHSLFVVGSTNVTGDINVGGASTFVGPIDINGGLDVDGNINVSGVSTFVGVTTNQSTIFGKQLSITGVSTFLGGPVLIGSGTSTGTSDQKLQVTGGGYISSYLGIGFTNPSSNLAIYDSSGSWISLVDPGQSSSAFENNNGSLYIRSEEGTGNSEIIFQTGTANYELKPSVSGATKVKIDKNGNLIVDSNVGTGFSGQKLQVFSGAYISENLGIGTAVPSAKLHVSGDILITGVSTFAGIATITGTTLFTNQLSVSGLSTFVGVTTNQSTIFGTQLSVSGVSTFIGVTTFTTSDVFISNQLFVGGLAVTGGASIGQDITTRNLSVSGLSTFTGAIDADGGAYIDNIQIGITNDNEIDTTSGNLVLDSAGGTTTIDDQLVVSGITTFNSAINANGDLDVDGHTELDNVNVSGIITATAFHTGAEGSAIRITSNTISGPAEMLIDPSAVGDNTGAVRIKGDLYVDGTQFVVNSTTIELADFNVGIATTVGTNLILDGAGIGIGSDNIRKTFVYDNASNTLQSSIGLGVTVGGDFKTGTDSVLNKTTLGPTVVNSSLTSVGTLSSLNVSGLSTFAGITTVTGSTLFTNQLSVSGVSTFVGVTTNQSTIFGTQLSVSGVSTFTGAIDANGDLDVDGHTELDNVNISGITTFAGAIDANGDLDVDGHTELDNVNISGITTFAGTIDANGDLDVDGHTELDNVSVSGVSTFVGVTTNQSTIFGTQLSVSGISTFNNFIIAPSLRNYSSLVGTASSTTTTFVVTVASKTTNHRYYGTGSGLGYYIDGIESPFLTLLPGKTYRFNQEDGSNNTHPILFYYDAAKTTQHTTNVTTSGTAGSPGAYVEIVVTDITPVVLHYQCSNHGYMGNAAQFNSNVVDTPHQITTRSGLSVTGVSTFTGAIDANGDLDVDGHTELDNVNISGITTFAGAIDANGDLDVDGHTELDNVNISENLNVVGLSTFAGITTVTGQTFFTNQLSVSGVSTFTGAIDANGDLDVDGHTELDNVNISGITTFVGAIDANGDLDVDGHTELDNVNVSGIITATAFHTGAEGSAIRITSNTISGPATLTIDPAAVGDDTGTVVIKGSLQIDGTTTTVNSTTMTIDDKNIVLGSGAANDAAADGGGITIESGEGNKTFQFEDTGDNLGSSENLNVASGKVYKINNTEVLSSTTLGSGVVNSSLTSVGVLGQLSVTGISTFTGAIDANGDLDVDGHTELDNVNISGITTFAGSIDANGDLDVDGDTELDNVNISGTLNVTGLSTFAGITTVTGPTLFTNQLSVSGVSTFFGAIDANGDLDVDGHTELDNVNISGVSTFAGVINANSHLDVAGDTELENVNIGEKLNVVGIATFAGITTVTGKTFFTKQLSVSGFSTFVGVTTNQSTIFGTQLSVSGVSTFIGVTTFTTSDVFISNQLFVGGLAVTGGASIGQDITTRNLSVSGLSTFTGAIDANGDLDVDGHTELDNVNISGITTFAGAIVANGDLDVDGHTELDNVNISGITTFAGAIVANGDLDVDGHTELDNVNISGITTFAGAIVANGDLDVDGHTELDNVNISGITTFAGAIDADGGAYIDNIQIGITNDNEIDTTSGNLVLDSAGGTTTIDDKLVVSGITTFNSTINANSNLDVDGHTELDNVNVSGIITATAFHTGAEGSAIRITSNTISGPATLTIDPAAVGDDTGLVIIKGDLQIDGTTTTVNSTTMTIDDKNIVLGSGAANDAAADGGGITIESGEGNKTFQFEDTGDNLGSSENLNVASGKVYKINNTEVLSSTTLGSGVVNSSLTSVGVLGQLSVTGISTFTETIDANGDLDVDGHTELDNVNISGITTFAAAIDANGDLDVDGHTELDNVNISGITTFAGSIDANGDLDVDGHTELDNVNISGITTFTGAIDANGDLDVDGHTELDNVNISENLNVVGVSTFAGITTVTGQTFFTNQLSVSGVSTFTGAIDANGDLDVDGHTELDNVNISGITTFAAAIDANGDLDVDGHTELDNVNISGITTFAGTIDANGDLDVDGHTELDNVNISGITTFAGTIDANGDLDVDGHTELDNVNISGVSTFAGVINANSHLDVAGDTELDNVNISGTLNVTGLSTFAGITTVTGKTFFTKQLSVSGFSTFVGVTTNQSTIFGTQLSVSGVSTFIGVTTFTTSNVFIDNQLFVGGLAVTGGASIGPDITTRNLSVSGLSTFTGAIDADGDLDVDGHTELDNVNISGITTFAGAIDANGDLDVDGHTELDNVNISGITTFGAAIDANGDLDVDGHTELDNVNISGITTFVGVIDANGDLDVDGHTELDNVNIGEKLNVVGFATFAGITTVTGATLFAKQLSVSGVITATTFIGALEGNAGTATTTTNIPNLTGDITSVNTVTTLATVNSNVGTFGSQTLIPIVTVNAKGLVTAVSTAVVGTALTIAGDSGTVDIDLLSETLTISGGTNLTSVGSGNSITVNLDDSISLTNINVTGLATFAGITTVTGPTLFTKQLNVSGITTTNSLSIDATQVLSSARQLQNIASLDATTTATIESAIQLAPNDFNSLNISGLSTFAGITTVTGPTLFAKQLNVSGVSTLAVLHTPSLTNDGSDFGTNGYLIVANGSGGWNWDIAPGLFSVNNILNGFTVSEENSIVGAAGSIIQLDFRGNNIIVSADSQPNGIATVRVSDTPSFTTLNVSGVSTFSSATFSGNVSIGGTLTYEDVTNIDSIGVVTARSSVTVGAGLSVVGFTTLSSAGGITTTGGDLYVEDDIFFKGNLYQNNQLFSAGIGIGSTAINPLSGTITSSARVGVGFTDINFVGTGLSVTGYGSTVVIDFGNISASSGGSVAISTSPPGISTSTGALWWESDSGDLKVYYNDGDSAQWIDANGGSQALAIISESSPAGYGITSSGTLWWDSGYGVLKVYYDDGSSQQWVDANSGAYINFWVGNSAGIHTLSSVGIGTTNPTEKLQINGNLSIDGNVSYGTSIFTTTSTALVGIHSTLTIANYRSVEYTIQATEGTNFHTTKIIALHDGTTAYHTEYGSIFNNVGVSTYNVDVSGGNIRLLATPSSASSTNFKVLFNGIKV
jgi:hypothetical protein